jgi:dTDP-4-dehydrorhamnose reductase
MPGILVTGVPGQVGTELLRRARPEHKHLDFRGLSIGELDITDADAVAAAIRGYDLVVNAAAYTAVDQAESDRERAHAVNALGPGNLAAACASAGIPIIQISTDYVFDGTKDGPWEEDDPVSPISVYGASKEAGERAVRDAHDGHVILRTSWLYAAHGHNFVRTMLRLGRERKSLRVVDDQVGAPTAAGDVAAAIVAIADRLLAGDGGPFGTYHYTAQGQTTWRGFADAIFACAEPRWGCRPSVEPIRTRDFPTPAARPANSVLACERITRVFDPPRRPWRAALEDVMAELLDQETVKGQA